MDGLFTNKGGDQKPADVVIEKFPKTGDGSHDETDRTLEEVNLGTDK